MAKSDKGSASTSDSMQGNNSQSGGNVRSGSTDFQERGRLGGEAAQQSGNAHEFNSEERSQGGQNSRSNRG